MNYGLSQQARDFTDAKPLSDDDKDGFVRNFVRTYSGVVYVNITATLPIISLKKKMLRKI